MSFGPIQKWTAKNVYACILSTPARSAHVRVHVKNGTWWRQNIHPCPCHHLSPQCFSIFTGRPRKHGGFSGSGHFRGLMSRSNRANVISLLRPPPATARATRHHARGRGRKGLERPRVPFVVSCFCFCVILFPALRSGDVGAHMCSTGKGEADQKMRAIASAKLVGLGFSRGSLSLLAYTSTLLARCFLCDNRCPCYHLLRSPNSLLEDPGRAHVSRVVQLIWSSKPRALQRESGCLSGARPLRPNSTLSSAQWSEGWDLRCSYLPGTPVPTRKKWMFPQTTISYVKDFNCHIGTTICF